MATKVIFEDVDHPQFNSLNQTNSNSNSNNHHNQHQQCGGHGHGTHQHGAHSFHSHHNNHRIKMENNSDHSHFGPSSHQPHPQRMINKIKHENVNNHQNIMNNNYNDSNSKLIKHESRQQVQPQQPPRKRIFVSYHNKQNGIFGCKHYARNCFLKADCCNQWYVCRFCHDERCEESNSINGGMPHQINRYATKYCKCMRCGEEQPISQHCNNCTIQQVVKIDDGGGGNTSSSSSSVKQETKMNNKDDDGDMSMISDHCTNSNIKQEQMKGNSIKKETNGSNTKVITRPYSFGGYYCNICKFHDDTPGKQIFHCLECGLCRLGRQTDYIHCQRCGCCLNYKYYAKHPCIENSLKSDCPICFTYLFKSREPVTFFMPCGHPIHYDCLLQYAKVGAWRCPICRTGWYDEQSEKRKKIVQAIKGRNKNQNIVLHQNGGKPGHGIIITNPAAHTSSNMANQSPNNVNMNSLMSPSPAPSSSSNRNISINNHNHNINQHPQVQRMAHQQMPQQK